MADYSYLDSAELRTEERERILEMLYAEGDRLALGGSDLAPGVRHAIAIIEERSR